MKGTISTHNLCNVTSKPGLDLPDSQLTVVIDRLTKSFERKHFELGVFARLDYIRSVKINLGG